MPRAPDAPRQDLVLVAMSDSARLYRRDHERGGLSPLETLHAAAHPETGEPPDRAGHVRSDQRPGGTTLSPHTDPRLKLREEFARRLAHRLEVLLSTEPFEALDVFAGPAQLGDLRSKFGRHAQAHLRVAESTDLTHASSQEVAQRLERLLESARGTAEAPGATHR